MHLVKNLFYIKYKKQLTRIFVYVFLPHSVCKCNMKLLTVLLFLVLLGVVSARLFSLLRLGHGGLAGLRHFRRIFSVPFSLVGNHGRGFGNYGLKRSFGHGFYSRRYG